MSGEQPNQPRRDSSLDEFSFAKQTIPQQSFQSSLSLNTFQQPPPRPSSSDRVQQLLPQQQQEFNHPDDFYDEQDEQDMNRSDTLTLNALKKLSLVGSNVSHPSNINDDENPEEQQKDVTNHNHNNNTVEQDNIDLSTFASLTRQPRLDSNPELVETSILNNLTSVSSEMQNASTESDGLMLRPMRRESKNVMSQYERRRPVSPSPLLKGELLDLPTKSQILLENNSDSLPQQDFTKPSETNSLFNEVKQQQPILENRHLIRTRTDNIKSDTNLTSKSENLENQHKLSLQQFRPATLLTTSEAPKLFSQPASATVPTFNIHTPPPAPTTTTAPSNLLHQQPPQQYSYSNPVIPTASGLKDDERYKDPQSINKLKRPLYVPAVLRPNLANNYSDMTSSHSSLNSDKTTTSNNEISKDLLLYKEYNNLNFGNGVTTTTMIPSISQQSSLSSSPSQQQQNKIGKMLEKFISSKPSSPPPPPPPPPTQQQLSLQPQSSSDASSIFSNSSSNFEAGPTREHWKLDTVLLRCTNCNKIFTNFGKIRRKHHCRSCGDIFCTNCINHYIYLNKDANFVLIDTKPANKNKKLNKNFKFNQQPPKDEKFLSKVCYHCFENYENLLRQTNPAIFNVPVLKNEKKQDNDDEEEDEEDEYLRNGSSLEMNPNTRGSISLPADWNWSSF